MLVFKFGGASVKSAEAVKNIADILKNHDENIVVVVSAMGKTTNALERVVEFFASGDHKAARKELRAIREYHFSIMEGLFPEKEHPVYDDINTVMEELHEKLQKPPTLNFDFDYDQIVSYGEILSTKIVAYYINANGSTAIWKDVRRSIKTDETYREGKVDWALTEDLMKTNFSFGENQFIVTQGFLGSTVNDMTTTLGREGSDYTAAIIAYVLRAEKVVIWKDVPGVLNADPKWFDETVLLRQLSYLDAIELAYYGASVIHPKTIKPLRNKNINLYVKSFLHPDAEGTVIGNLTYDKLVPSFIFKMDQVLVRISPTDFSFINENNLQEIFGILNQYGVKINLMQNSAIWFFICFNNDKRKLPQIIENLEKDFRVSYETGLELITIRYFDEATIERVMINKELILEHRGQQNIQLMVRDIG
jgi:aspartate kinase